MKDEANKAVSVPDVLDSSLIPHPSSLRMSFAVCHAITAGANSSFPAAFRLLSPARRRAMDALYAYERVTDDLAEQPATSGEWRVTPAGCRPSLSAALAGEFTHPIQPALVDTVRRFDVPPRCLSDAIDG